MNYIVNLELGCYWLDRVHKAQDVLSFRFHLCQHSLAYWIIRNEVLHEAISVNVSKVLSPTITCLLFVGMQETHGKSVHIKFQQF